MSSYDLSEWPLFRAVIDEASVNRNKSRTCLILCPGGESDGDLERHAGVVLKYIIQPALIDSSYAAHRAENAAEGVSEAGVESILRDDLVIAVLTGRSPEVFYQVAVAQAAGRPLILMVESGKPLGIHPRGAPLIEYSVDTDSILSAENVQELNAAIKAFESDTPPVQQGFQPRKAMPRSAANSTGATLLERGSDFSYDQKLAMMREASQRIDIFGVASASLAKHPDMAGLIRSRSGHDLQIRVLQAAPGNPGIGALIGTRDATRLTNVREEIDSACDAWKSLCNIEGVDLAISVRLAQDAIPLSYSVITEKAAITTPYRFSKAASESASVHALAGSRFHTAMIEEFDALWPTASPFLRRERQSETDQGGKGPVALDRFSPSNDADPRTPDGRQKPFR